MTHTSIENINDSLVRISSRIHSLQNLIIDYHFEEKPWYEIWGPYIIAITASLLAIWGQIIIFRLSRTKEINIKVAELYGKLNALHPEYNILFLRYNKTDVEYRFHNFLDNHYRKIMSEEEWGADLGDSEKDEFYNTQKYYSSQSDILNSKGKKEFEDYKNQKLKVVEILHQIHFYYKDKQLEKLINDFQNFFTHKPNWENYSKEMRNESYLNNYITEKINPISSDLKTHSEKIFERIRNLKA